MCIELIDIRYLMGKVQEAEAPAARWTRPDDRHTRYSLPPPAAAADAPDARPQTPRGPGGVPRTPSLRVSAGLAALMLGIGIAVGAAIGPAPGSSLAGTSDLPLLLRALSALEAGRQASAASTPAATAPPASPVAAAASPASRSPAATRTPSQSASATTSPTPSAAAPVSAAPKTKGASPAASLPANHERMADRARGRRVRRGPGPCLGRPLPDRTGHARRRAAEQLVDT